jgi:hypothetical protein
MNYGFIHTKIPFFRFPKEIFIVASNIRFKLLMANNSTLIVNKRMNKFLYVCAGRMEVSCIRISIKDELYLRSLIPF